MNYRPRGYSNPHPVPAQRTARVDRSAYHQDETGNLLQQELNDALQQSRAAPATITAQTEEINAMTRDRGIPSGEATQSAATDAASSQKGDVPADVADPDNEDDSKSSATSSSSPDAATDPERISANPTTEVGTRTSTEELPEQDQPQGSAEAFPDATSPTAATSTSPAQTSDQAGTEAFDRDYSAFATVADVLKAPGFQPRFASADAAREHAFRRIKMTGISNDDVDTVKNNAENYVRRIMEALATSTYLENDPRNKMSQENWKRWQDESGQVLQSVMSESDKDVLVTQIEAKARLIVEEIIKVHEMGYRPYINVDRRSTCSARMEKAIKSIQDYTKVREDIIRVFDVHQFAAHPELFGKRKGDNAKCNDKKRKDKVAATGKQAKAKKRITDLTSAIYYNLYSREEINQKIKDMEAAILASGGDNGVGLDAAGEVEEQNAGANDVEEDAGEGVNEAEVDDAASVSSNNDRDEDYESPGGVPTKKRGVKRSMGDNVPLDSPAPKRARLLPEASEAKKAKSITGSARLADAPSTRTTRRNDPVDTSTTDVGGGYEGYEGNPHAAGSLPYTKPSLQGQTNAAAGLTAAQMAGPYAAGATQLGSQSRNMSSSVAGASASANPMQTRGRPRGKDATMQGKRKQG